MVQATCTSLMVRGSFMHALLKELDVLALEISIAKIRHCKVPTSDHSKYEHLKYLKGDMMHI